MTARILVIEDEESFRLLLRRRLAKAGYEVIEAPNGEVGRRAVDEEQPDLIITDLIMPEKEGLELIMELNAGNRKTPIIAISGGGRTDPRDYLQIAREFGVKYAFAKPFDWQPFMDAIAELVSTAD